MPKFPSLFSDSTYNYATLFQQQRGKVETFQPLTDSEADFQ